MLYQKCVKDTDISKITQPEYGPFNHGVCPWHCIQFSQPAGHRISQQYNYFVSLVLNAQMWQLLFRLFKRKMKKQYALVFPADVFKIWT
jgi:hypothetical protein